MRHVGWRSHSFQDYGSVLRVPYLLCTTTDHHPSSCKSVVARGYYSTNRRIWEVSTHMGGSTFFAEDLVWIPPTLTSISFPDSSICKLWKQFLHLGMSYGSQVSLHAFYSCIGLKLSSCHHVVQTKRSQVWSRWWMSLPILLKEMWIAICFSHTWLAIYSSINQFIKT